MDTQMDRHTQDEVWEGPSTGASVSVGFGTVWYWCRIDKSILMDLSMDSN